jgi:hypothetical protein
MAIVMSTPKGWTNYTGGIYSVKLPVRKTSKIRTDFRTTSLQDFLEARTGEREHRKNGPVGKKRSQTKSAEDC